MDDSGPDVPYTKEEAVAMGWQIVEFLSGAVAFLPPSLALKDDLEGSYSIVREADEELIKDN